MTECRAGMSNGRRGAPAPAATRGPPSSDSGEDAILAAGRAYAAHSRGQQQQQGNAEAGPSRRAEGEHSELVRGMRARGLATLERRISERDRAARHLQRAGRASLALTAADRADDARLRELRAEVARDRRTATRAAVERHGRETRRDVMRQGVWDPEDRVRRCIDCNWELEDSKCHHW